MAGCRASRFEMSRIGRVSGIDGPVSVHDICVTDDNDDDEVDVDAGASSSDAFGVSLAGSTVRGGVSVRAIKTCAAATKLRD